jgi:hypothetical protein
MERYSVVAPMERGNEVSKARYRKFGWKDTGHLKEADFNF